MRDKLREMMKYIDNVIKGLDAKENELYNMFREHVRELDNLKLRSLMFITHDINEAIVHLVDASIILENMIREVEDK